MPVTLNGFGRTGNGMWLPMRREGERFCDPSGLLVVPPTEWRDATAEDIMREMAERGEAMIRI